MTAIDGFRLTFSDNTVYRATQDVGMAFDTQPLYLIDGLRNLVTLWNEYITAGGFPGRSDSNYSGAFYGFGAGIHTITVTFPMAEGFSDTWGSTSATDPALTKLSDLNRTITTTRADSEAPALLEIAEYDDSQGAYSPIPVALGETSLSWEPQGESVSEFRAQLTMYDAVDLGEAVDAVFRQ